MVRIDTGLIWIMILSRKSLSTGENCHVSLWSQLMFQRHTSFPSSGSKESFESFACFPLHSGHLPRLFFGPEGAGDVSVAFRWATWQDIWRALVGKARKLLTAYTARDYERLNGSAPRSLLFLPKQKTKQTPWPLVRERTIPTDRPPLVDEFSVNFCG
jgi:hypothetical protein